MIYIENDRKDPTYNLAFEEYIFGEKSFREPVLILWQNEPSVIIGRYQDTIEEINYDFIREKGIHVVRRNTGGGAVYHDLGNLNYSFVLPRAENMTIDFDTFTAPVIKALRSVGVDAEKSGRNDILAGGRKFSGNAQHISGGRLLHHGTLMFDVNMDDVASALRVKAGKFRSKATKSVRSRVTNLKPLIDSSMGIETTEDFKRLLLEWFEKEYDIVKMSFEKEDERGEEAAGEKTGEKKLLPAAGLEKILELQKDKYMTDEWNFGRSPKADVTRGDFFRCGQVVFNFSIESHIIKDLKITGDFFSGGDIRELEEAFIGVPYERKEILRVLESGDLGLFLGDVTADELIDVIV